MRVFKIFVHSMLLVSFLNLLAISNSTAVPPPTEPGEIRADYDVVIAGAGTGGFGAAVQAARMGATVLLLEETDWIGGQAMAAGVTSMDEAVNLVRERGLYRDFTNKVVAHYGKLGMSAMTAYGRQHLCMEPRVGQEIMYAMLDEARAKTKALHVLLRSRVTEVQKKGDLVTGFTIEQNGGATPSKRQIASKILVDATEWGDVLPLTGARYRVGKFTSDQQPDPKMLIQDLTWTATIKQYPGGVPAELVLQEKPPGYDAELPRFTRSLLAEAPGKNSERPWGFKTFVAYRGMPNSEQPRNKELTRTHMNFNNDYPVSLADFLDPQHRIETEQAAMVRTLNLLYYVQHDLGKADWSVANDEGYDTPYQREQIDRLVKARPELAPYRAILNHFAVMAYARESRRVVGLHALTAPEIERNPGKPTPFPTSVALGDYPVDLHGSKKANVLELELETEAAAPLGKFGEKGKGPFAIPFECFVPEKLDGFLPAEKNLSQSRLANGATRLQPSTMLMGQAVGAMAALCVKYQVQPRALDPVLVQDVLLDEGDTLFLTPIKDIPKSGWEWKPVQFATTHGLLTAEDGKFDPAAPITAADARRVALGLLNSPTQPTFEKGAGNLAETREAFWQTLKNVDELSRPNVRFGPAPAEREKTVTRLEAARLITAYAKARALAKLNQESPALMWPEPKALSPMTHQDADPDLRMAVQLLTERQLLNEPEYWLKNAVPNGQVDGERMAELFRKAVERKRPGTPAAQVLQVAVEEGFCSSAEYWGKAAQPGKQCDGRNVAAVLRYISTRTAE